MRTETIEIFRFEELSEEAKQNAVEKMYDLNVSHNWWEFTYEDAKRIGLKINGFDLNRGSHVNSEMLWGGSEVVEAILEQHGESCGTHTLAKEYEEKYKALDKKYTKDETLCDFEEESFELDSNLKEDLQKEYLKMLRNEMEHLMSEEAIIETIKANEYEFTANGEQH